jgi:hypothetical protein
MHTGQVSQVEEESRSLSGFRARSYAPTQCSCDPGALRTAAFVQKVGECPQRDSNPRYHLERVAT